MSSLFRSLALLLALAFGLAACGGGGSTSTTTTVTAPAITTQPASISVASGAAASFSVVATGDSLTYQWSKDSTAINGATSATYSITAATSSDAGSYTVVVTNTAGTVTSSAATLTVTAAAPVITTQPASTTVAPGSSASLSVVATGDSLTYQWSKDGSEISGATSATYTIASAATTDAGSYTVVVTNTVGSVTSSAATLTVSSTITAPAITTQPASVSTTAGSSATFSVVATGTSPTYQWYFAGTAISGATSATYTISSVAAANAGAYYVIVTNSAGTVTSATATLSVTVASTGSNTSAVVTAANAFLATLSTTQQTVATSSSSTSTVLFGYTLANAETWTNLPGGRHGLRLNSSTLTTTQLAAASTLISAALSSTGVTMMSEIRLADDVIASTTTNSPWGSTLYSIAFIGTPSTTGTWMLQLTGHHLAYNITYNGTYVSATPMFIGVEPPNWVVNGTTVIVNGTASTSGTQHAPLEAQRLAMYNLATAIQADTSISTSATLSGTFTDVVMGVASGGDTNYKTLSYPTSGRGVLYGSLSTAEKAYVKAAIEAWVNTQASDISTTLLAVYESDTALASTYVGLSPGQGGTCDFSAYPNSLSSPLTAQHSYIRIDGPRVWIEMVIQQGVAYTSYVHYHSLWRDKTADYGGDF